MTTHLLIDLGNTRLKWACYHAGELQPVGLFVVDPVRFVDDLSTSWSGLKKPDTIILSSDVDETLTAALNSWTKHTWGVEVTLINAEANAYAVKNAYAEPIKLGSDRWASLVAVKNTLNQAAIIVDCGTAITIDAISYDGEHQGGIILPGIKTMYDALTRKTHKISSADTNTQYIDMDIDSGVRVAALANNTTDGISNGIYTSAVACINEMVDQIKSTIAKDTHSNSDNELACIITGGDAQAIQGLLSTSFEYKPNLVLEGLAYMADHSK